MPLENETRRNICGMGYFVCCKQARFQFLRLTEADEFLLCAYKGKMDISGRSALTDFTDSKILSQ